MRIVISSPDGMGDALLRQPMFAAMQEAGHQLLLLVREAVAPLVPYIAPGAEQEVWSGNPYARGYRPDPEMVKRVSGRVREFAPDLLVIAPYQWTEFEESLCTTLRRVPVVGMSGCGRLRSHRLSTIRFTRQACVEEYSHDLEKNHHLGETVLERPLKQRDPRLHARPEDLERAAQRLAEHELKGQDFWIASVGRDPASSRSYSITGWAKILSHWVERHDRKLVFTGTPEELAAIHAVVEAMGKSKVNAVIPVRPPMTLNELIGLSALSSGFIGHDTGVMHIAAALDKPNISIFGGGHWGRFLPASERSYVFTMDTPCRCCDYQCPFDNAVCIKETPATAVTELIDRLEAGRAEASESHVLPLPESVKSGLFGDLLEEYGRMTKVMYQLPNDVAEATREIRMRDAQLKQLKQLNRELQEKLQGRPRWVDHPLSTKSSRAPVSVHQQQPGVGGRRPTTTGPQGVITESRWSRLRHLLGLNNRAA